MAQQDTSTSPPAKPVIRTYPTPDLRDRIYVEARDARLPGYELPGKGTPYEGREAPRYEGWVFATAQPSDKVGWTDHFYLNERLNQDEYNFSIDYPWVDKEYPRHTRTYVFLRTDFKESELLVKPVTVTGNPGDLIAEPCPHQTDSRDARLVLVNWKLERLQDPVLDSLFVGVTKIFERVPAPIKVVLDRPEHVLSFNQRVAVPAIIETVVHEDATDGAAPEIVNEEDWHTEETTDSAFRKTVETTKRKIPLGGSWLQGEQLTRQQQVSKVTSLWQIGLQTITPRATVLESSVLDVGNNTTVKEETTVARVFPAGEFRVSIPDTVPIEFRDILPVRTTGITGEGQAGPRNLGPGELERISEQTTDFIARETVTGRDLDQLPKTLVDQEIDGIPTHGSTFGGIFDIARTLDRAPQAVEEGFGIIRSSVKNLGSGLTARETERLATLQGAHLLLTNPGQGFVCDPAVLFSSGTIGSGATATAILSELPIVGSGEDLGGVFPLTFSGYADTNGVFYFLGARYNAGTWQNPTIGGIVRISSTSANPQSPDQLAGTVDRAAGPPLALTPLAGGGHYIAYDLGGGRRLSANKITIRTNPAPLTGLQTHYRLEGFNNFVDTPTTLAEGILPNTPDGWSSVTITDPTTFRYFRLFGTESTHGTFGFGELELYGTITITPAAVRNYVFPGDENGVFFYMGSRGNNGIWRNPHTSGDIVVAADDLAFGSLAELVDRQPSNVYTDASGDGAFYFDLRAGRSLICNKLTFRQRSGFSSGTAVFYLQGRNDVSDPLDWSLPLAVIHPSLNPDVWTVVDVPVTIGYRQFRLISPQPFFTIGECELYGELSLGPPGGTNISVTAIQMTNGGSNYITPPEVRICGGGGSGAAGTAVVVAGAVTHVDLTSPGSGFTSVPTVSFFVPGGGVGATATPTLLAGAVTGAVINTPGSEYGAAPEVLIVGNGTGATAHATVTCAGAIATVVIDTPGTGYTVASIVFKNAGGPTAIATVGYGLNLVAVNNGGASYETPPVVDFAGDGIGATASAILGFSIASVIMTNRGDNYSSAAIAVHFTGDGSGATGSAIRGFSVASVSYSPNGTFFLTPPPVIVTGGGIYGEGASFEAIISRPILAIAVGAGGSAYTGDTAVVITGDGAGATAHVVRSFVVASIAASTPGSGYTSPPLVTIDPPTGSQPGIQATAHAVLTGATVTSIVIDNPGYGYLTAPGVTLSGGGGTGATGTATLATTGAIDVVVVDTVGAGYTAPPIITTTGTGGAGAILTATLNTSVPGFLTRIDVLTGGTGYTFPPTLSVAGGTTPTAVLASTGQIVGVSITGIGTLYTIPALVTFTGGGGGSGAGGTGVLETSGKVKTVTITNRGEGFTVAPGVVFTGGGFSSTAVATATLQATGKIKTLTLIDPGPEYTVAPLVSFAGCSGINAAALYILGTGWPVLTDIITDPVEGIVVNVVKKIVPAETARPVGGYIDIYALDKYRSIQITSAIDLSTLPPVEVTSQTHVMSLPPLLVSVGAAYSRDSSQAIRINEGFGSASVKSTVRGKIVVTVKDGYKGPAKAKVIRKFLPYAPTEAQTPDPLIITPSSGTAYITTRHRAASNSGGTTGGFSYVEISQDTSEAQDTLDISGVLTGALGVSSSSGALLVTADDIKNQGISMALARGINDQADIAIAVAYARVSATANLFLTLPQSCPGFLNPGTTFLLSAGVEKWRFGIYVQTLIYVTIPEPCPTGTPGGPST